MGAKSPEMAPKTAHSRDGVGRLVAVHAHPDDETLATGALLATWSESGGHATVISCTRGEQGEVIGAELAHLEGNAAALAAHREVELVSALQALGVAEHHFLDQLPTVLPEAAAAHGPAARYADSGMAWRPGQKTGTAAAPENLPADAFVAANLDEAAKRLAAFLDQTEPDVVVTYDPGGGYGHPDHVRTHDVTMRAVELAQRAQPVVLWASMGPEELRQQRRDLAHAPWAQASAQQHDLEIPDPDGDLPALANADRPVAIAVTVRPVLTNMLAALTAHGTQVHAITRSTETENATLLGSYSLSNNVLAGIGTTESYSWGRSDSEERARHLRWPRYIDEAQKSTPAEDGSSGPTGNTSTGERSKMLLTKPPWFRCFGIVVLGVVIGLIGSLMFRSVPPWGLVVSCATLLSASVLARAWAQAPGVISLGLGWVVMVQIMALEGPGGDVIIPADPIGYVWVFGGVVFVLAAMLAPRSWFRDDEFVGS